MVYDFGMSEQIGFVRVDRQRGVYAGGAEAVRGIIEGQVTRARQILSDRREVLDRIVQGLVDRGRLDKHELLEIMTASKEVPPLVL